MIADQDKPTQKQQRKSRGVQKDRRWEGERLAVVKDLMLAQQAAPSDQQFKKILKRVDALLISTAASLRRSRWFLKPTPVSDLYQSAILGLYGAIRTIKPDDDPQTVPARIISYVKKEIFSKYSCAKKEAQFPDEDESDSTVFSSIRFRGEVSYSIEDEIFARMECDELVKLCSGLLREGILTDRDIQVIRARAVDRRTLDSIATEMGVCKATVWNWAKSALDKVKEAAAAQTGSSQTKSESD